MSDVCRSNNGLPPISTTPSFAWQQNRAKDISRWRNGFVTNCPSLPPEGLSVQSKDNGATQPEIPLSIALGRMTKIRLLENRQAAVTKMLVSRLHDHFLCLLIALSVFALLIMAEPVVFSLKSTKLSEHAILDISILVALVAIVAVLVQIASNYNSIHTNPL